MQDLLKKNLWNFLATLVAISVGWAILSSRVTSLEAQDRDINEKITNYNNLFERVVRLEENRQTVVSDIRDIKEDIKDLKKYFNLP